MEKESRYGLPLAEQAEAHRELKFIAGRLLDLLHEDARSSAAFGPQKRPPSICGSQFMITSSPLLEASVLRRLLTL